MSEESIVGVEPFLLASEEYCAFIERADQIGRPELLHGVHCRLADVYAAALRLPEVRSGLPPSVENLSADASSWDKSGEIALAKQLKRLVGDVDLTKEVYGEEALPDRLSDDLASVYFELRGGLDLWSVGDQKEEILWEWTFGFIHHWGPARNKRDAAAVASYDVRISGPGVGIMSAALTRMEAETLSHIDGNVDGNAAEPC